jgi:hypothetical protein
VTPSGKQTATPRVPRCRDSRDAAKICFNEEIYCSPLTRPGQLTGEEICYQHRDDNFPQTSLDADFSLASLSLDCFLLREL